MLLIIITISGSSSTIITIIIIAPSSSNSKAWSPNSQTRPSSSVENESNHKTNLRSQQISFVLYFCTLCSQRVSAFTKSHLQVILYNTKYLKRSYHIIATGPLSQYKDNRQKCRSLDKS
jgi:hypothetical protein